MEKIKFEIGASSPFFTSLDKKVKRILSQTKLMASAKKLLWRKMAVYTLIHLLAYAMLFFLPHPHLASLAINYVFVGLSGILLALNVSHDACHGSFSKNRTVNNLIYHITFNLQGPNAYLWKLRHTASHHIFPNVDGCDADIDDNPVLRLSPQHPLRWYQRAQHLYSFFAYCIYTLHWFLFKDVLYLFKKRVANLVNKKHRVCEWIMFFFWKFLYLFILLILPVVLGYDFKEVLVSFLVMHAVDSLFFIHALIPTHFCMETLFPHKNDKGLLPFDYYEHQLATSLDYYPTSYFCNLFMGGFNAHAAHHLYPKLPHTVYPFLSKMIQHEARKFGLPYNKLSYPKAIWSHYRYLKMMGNEKH